MSENIERIDDALHKLQARVRNWERWEPHTPHCEVYNNSAIVVATASYVAVTFDTEADDLDGMHSLVSNTERVTILIPGIYHVDVGVALEVSAQPVGYRQLTLCKNAGAIATHIHAPAGTANYLTTSKTVRMAVGDYFKALVYQTSGGDLNTVKGEGATWMTVTFVGG